MLKLKYLFENFALAKECIELYEYNKETLDEMVRFFRISSNAIYPFRAGENAVNLDGGLFVDLNPIFKEKPILVLRSTLNYKANRKLKEVGCMNVTVEKFRKVTHWEFSDGVYLGSKGMNDRHWADRISMARTETCLDF